MFFIWESYFKSKNKDAFDITLEMRQLRYVETVIKIELFYYLYIAERYYTKHAVFSTLQNLPHFYGGKCGVWDVYLSVSGCWCHLAMQLWYFSK